MHLNQALLTGVIVKAPVGIGHKEIEVMSFPMTVLRRPPRAFSRIQPQLRMDTPVVWTRDRGVIERIIELKLDKGDLVLVKGVLVSGSVKDKRQSVCPTCHENLHIDGTITFVTPTMVEKIPVDAQYAPDGTDRAAEMKKKTEAAFTLLKNWAETSNLVTIWGNVCKGDPNNTDEHGERTAFYVDNKGGKYNQFQLAVPRAIMIPWQTDEDTDYPWVKCYGRQAEESYQALRVGSSIVLTASIQTRKIERSFVCPNCGQAITYEEPIAELVPYGIEYDDNCIKPQPEAASIVSDEPSEADNESDAVNEGSLEDAFDELQDISTS